MQNSPSINLSKLLKVSSILLIICIAPDCGNLFLTGLQIVIFLLSFYVVPDRKIIDICKLLLIPIIFGTIIGIGKNHFYDVFKDIYYFFNPILYLLLGAILAKKYQTKELFIGILIAGFILSSFLIIFMITTYGITSLKDPRLARESIIDQNTFLMGFIATPISLLLLFCSRYSFHLNLIKNFLLWSFLILINLTALYVSASRTNFIILIISLIILLYFRYRHRKYLFWGCSILLLCIFCILFTTNKSSNFSKAMLHVSEEMSIRPATNILELNNNFRGHEAYMTLREFNKGHIENLLFGHGFGCMVDLGAESPLELRHIPIMHNGYPYILLKTGWIGLFLIFYWGFLILRLSVKTNFQKELFINYLPFSFLIDIYIINAFFYGIFHPRYVLLWVICGAALQYKCSFNYPKRSCAYSTTL